MCNLSRYRRKECDIINDLGCAGSSHRGLLLDSIIGRPNYNCCTAEWQWSLMAFSFCCKQSLNQSFHSEDGAYCGHLMAILEQMMFSLCTGHCCCFHYDCVCINVCDWVNRCRGLSSILRLYPVWQDGAPPLGWSDTAAYLVLPVLLVVSQYISMQLMQPPQVLECFHFQIYIHSQVWHCVLK